MAEKIRIVPYNNNVNSSSKRRLKSPIKVYEKEDSSAINLIDSERKEKNENNSQTEDNKKETKKDSKLICQKCGEANKNLYLCFDCELILCQNCKEESRHDKLIEYELFNIIAQYQLEKFTSYCEKCKINLDDNSKSNHETHSIRIFKDLNKDINLEELKQKISEIKKKIDDIVDKLNKIKDNLDFYYEVNQIINANIKNKKYDVLEAKEIINSDKTEIIREIDNVINKNNFEEILNNLEKIIDLKIPSNGLNTTQNTEKKEEIIMKLKFEKNNEIKRLRIFGDEFVENNKQCKMYIENKNYKELINDKNNNDTLNTESSLSPLEIVSEINLKDIDIDIDLDKDIIIHLISPNIISNLNCMFCNCHNLLSFEAISSNKKITNMSYMFCNCISLESISNISKWITSNVTDISAIFANCKKLKNIPDISKWDILYVTDMSYAFFNCESLESFPHFSKILKVEKMNYMFRGCIHLKSIPNNLEWNTANAYNMNHMFCNCQNLEDISPLSKLDFSKVNDMNNIFAECSSLKDISNFSIENAPNVEDISYMFFNCINLNTLPKKLGFNENKITDISCMFYNTQLKAENIKSKFLDNNRYQKADKTDILKTDNICLLM